MSDKVDEKFDKADKIVDRTGKLILKVVGVLVAIGLALFAGLDQLGGDEEYTEEPIEEYYEYEEDSIPVDSIYYGEEEV